MKVYAKPVSEILDVQSVDCLMGLAGSPDHGTNQAPQKRTEVF